MKARLICFSPTKTTKRIVESIAQGVQLAGTELLDLTAPPTRSRTFAVMQDELAIIGVPVYIGRIPTEARYRLQQLKGNRTPAVIVVVYGNRAYEDALLELREIVMAIGFIPIAGGAFIGEHSFSNSTTPIAHGRPDADDLRQATEFGKQIQLKLEKQLSCDAIPLLEVPGNFPYRESSLPSNIAPTTQQILCSSCGLCVNSCPTTAIAMQGKPVTDASRCILCFACIKSCTKKARTMNNPIIMGIARHLSANCQQRRIPETYL